MTFKPVFTAQELFPELQAQKSHFVRWEGAWLHLYVTQTLPLENISGALLILTLQTAPSLLSPHSLQWAAPETQKSFLTPSSGPYRIRPITKPS